MRGFLNTKGAQRLRFFDTRRFLGGFLMLSLLLCGKVYAMSDAAFLELCKKGNPQEISEALKHGANLEARTQDNYGYTPLMLAAVLNSNPESIKVLLRAGAKVEARNSLDVTALMLAATRNPNPEVFKALLDAGADIEARDGKFLSTSLLIATYKNPNPEVVKLLLERGANPYAKLSTQEGVFEMLKQRKLSRGEEIERLLKEAMAKNPPKRVASVTSSSPISDEAFLELCRKGTPQEIADALRRGANLNAKSNDKDGLTPLVLAAGANPNPEVVKLLLEAGANIEARSAKSLTPLIAAAGANPNPEVVRLLLERGANLEAKMEQLGTTPLIFATIMNPNPEVVKLLLERGADPYAKGNAGEDALDVLKERRLPRGEEIERLLKEAMAKRPPKRVASVISSGPISDEAFLNLCKRRTPEEIADALRRGANIESKNKDGTTPLMVAAVYNTNPEVIKVLLRGGADVEAKAMQGITALMLAASRNSNPEVTKVLLQAGAKLEVRNEKGATALTGAALLNPNAEVVKTLLDAGANVDTRDPSGVTPLMLAVIFNPNPEVIKLLLERGADPYARPNFGKSMLESLKEERKLSRGDEIERLLKEAMAKNPPKSPMSDEAFLGLCRRGTPQEISEALKYGANLEARTRDWDRSTPLMLAAAGNSNPESIKVLLRAGAKLEARNSLDVTALMLAAATNVNPEVTKALLDAGADIEARDGKFLSTSLLMAIYKNPNPEVVKLLLERGANPYAKLSTQEGVFEMLKQRKLSRGEEIERLLKEAMAKSPKGS